mmetsp:Transcript_41171/g.116549  ORF Transcript_41171/g.116549 Transcript_41171/m.116549 type:complete len:200 (-) Transcript_41171:454-1053(-)
MLGTLVRKCPSTLTSLPSISTPTSLRPRLSTYWRRPTLTSTASASSTCGSPPAAASVLTFIPAAVFSTPVTFVLTLMSMPCFLRTAWNCFATSASMPRPPIKPMNSTTVTLLPSLPQTELSSKPMTPPPITTSFSGTLSRASAPVLDTMRFSSSSTPGRLVTSEPVASMMFLASITCSVPALSATLTVLGPTSVPCPTA